MTRRLAAAVVIILLAAALPTTAGATWASPGTGRGYASADVAPIGKQPTVSVSGRNVTVAWAPSRFADGTSVNAYRVARYDAVTNAVAAVGSGCSGSIAALTCIENAVTPGSWYYRITPEHQSWVGSEGPASTTAVVATPTLTFATKPSEIWMPERFRPLKPASSKDRS